MDRLVSCRKFVHRIVVVVAQGDETRLVKGFTEVVELPLQCFAVLIDLDSVSVILHRDVGIL